MLSDVVTNRLMAKLGMAPQPVSLSDRPLTIHDVSKFFAVPIASKKMKCLPSHERLQMLMS
jgi:hypothetical protein